MSVLNANLCANGYFTVPGGYPLTLSAVGTDTVIGFLPKGAAAVVAKVASVTGVTPGADGEDPADNAPTTATVHLILFETPSTSGGADGVEVDDEETITGLGATEQEIRYAVPSGDEIAAACYVFRLWVSDLMGTNGVSVTSIRAE